MRPAAEALYAVLLDAPALRDFRRAFGQTTGLTVSLLPAAGPVPPGQGVAAEREGDGERESPTFCARMARLHAGCHECLEDERRAAATIGREPVVFECFPGLRRVILPVRSGGELVALLGTGPSLPRAPTDDGTGPGDAACATPRGRDRKTCPH